jgi:hypothetical protein
MCGSRKIGYMEDWVVDRRLRGLVSAKIKRSSRSLDSEKIITPERILMQRRGGLFARPSEQHIGQSNKMHDSAIERGAVYLVAWAHRSHFNSGDHHSGVRTFL